MPTYIIKKGNHYCNPSFPKIFWKPKKLIVNHLIFHNLENKPLPTPDNADWNKLIGFSRGNHKIFSWRLGWRIYNDELQIAPYITIFGQDYTTLNSWIYNLESEKMKNVVSDYHFTNLKIDFGNIKYANLPHMGYLLRPYHGGNLPANQDFKISIDFSVI